MKIVLISTSNVAAGRLDTLDRMLTSVARAASSRPDLSINLMLLLQECSAESASVATFPEFVETVSIPYRTSLSAARNILLSDAISRGLLDSATVVGFPDDDCWYPRGTLEYITDQFSHLPELDLWFCRYSSEPVSGMDVGIAPQPARVSDVIRQASSNTMFTRGRIIQAGASFDEQFGVGTALNGAEDTEFALRAHILGAQTIYLDAAVVGHRDKNPRLRAKYYRGGLIAIAGYAREQKGIALELVRKIGVGACLLVRQELSLSAYFGALSEAFIAWRTGKPGLIAASRRRKRLA